MTYQSQYSLESMIGYQGSSAAIPLFQQSIYDRESLGASFHSNQPLLLYEGGNRLLEVYNLDAYSPTVNAHKPKQYFSPDPFLRADRPATRFIGDAAEIQEAVEHTFQKLLGASLPTNIEIRVLQRAQFKEQHEQFGAGWSEGIQGFSINRHGFGASLIFLKQNDLDKVLVTTGHELGHVLSFTLPDAVSEEAKAFAFEQAWLQTLVENDIEGMAANILLQPMVPAKNGLHDKAWAFVKQSLNNSIQSGKQALSLFSRLSTLEVRANAA